MSIFQDNSAGIPEEQLRIRAKCYHPSGTFIEFRKEDIEQSIPERFAKQVRLYPHRLAVMTRRHALTYEALNRTANRIAHAILAQRGGDADSIALLLDHDAPLIAAMLSVLKTGKIYVPLDPSYPHARITYMLADSKAGLLVTNNKNYSLASALATDGLHIMNIDDPHTGLSAENPDMALSPGKPAFILYTSGSTGKPKGFIQTHRTVLHDIKNYTNAAHFCADDRLVLLSSCSFADSVRTIYSALLNGACLYPFDIRKEGLTDLADWLIRHEITVYRSVPTVFRHFGDFLTGEEEFPKLRLIFLAGESVYKRDVALYRQYFPPHCIFVNRLGTGECLTFRWYFIDKETPIPGSSVPVGYSVPDKRVVLIDETGQEIGFNQTGEIAVKSRYICPGYWRRPDLTQTKFLPDPDGRGECLYYTGDLGCMLPDGCLVHLGRKDFQVKIRGHRIEVSEVEMELLDIESIKDAAVIARKDKAGEQRLVAYLVSATQPAPTVSSLRRFLEQKFPDHMIPSHFVLLEALPLNTNNKVDRQALPEPGNDRPELENPFVPPLTPHEQTLAEIWCETLDIRPVGIHDKFLELGGNSLLATRIISRVVNTFQVKLSLQSLFAASTIAKMAVLVTQNQIEKADQKELDRMLADLEKLSDKKAKELTKLI